MVKLDLISGSSEGNDTPQDEARVLSMDEALMRKYQAGDSSAFEALYEQHHVGVYNVCLRTLRNPELAQEAMQEIFLKVVRAKARWTPTAKFKTWLYTIARNHLMDLRKKKVVPQEALQLEEVAPPRTDPPLQRALHEAIDQLSAEQREVFLLRAFAEMSFEEISEIVGSPSATMRSRMRLATKQLKKILSERGILP